MKKTILFVLFNLAFTGGAFASQPPLRCVIEPDRQTEVGSAVIGVVETILVERGDIVKQGQLLATLKASVERASVSSLRITASSVFSIAVSIDLTAARRWRSAGSFLTFCCSARVLIEAIFFSRSSIS